MSHHFHVVSYFQCCTNPFLGRYIFLCTGLNIIHKISCLSTTIFIHLFHYTDNGLCEFLHTGSMRAPLSSSNRWFKHILLSKGKKVDLPDHLVVCVEIRAFCSLMSSLVSVDCFTDFGMKVTPFVATWTLCFSVLYNQ
jgi:hypothetical protein